MGLSWSLSEFLNLIELRSQSWCLVDFGETQAIRAPRSEAIFFYACLQGELQIPSVSGGTTSLRTGDCAIMLSGAAHTLRHHTGNAVHSVPLLQLSGYVDQPVHVTLGTGTFAARALCGRLKVRWPAAARPRGLPALLHLPAAESIVQIDRVAESAMQEGGASLLTRLATLVFVAAFRRDPSCQALFNDFDLVDPVRRAQHFMKQHPLQRWTVEILAHKVGMARSSFARRFVEQTGKAPMEALTEVRMRMAADILVNTELKLAEVGEQVGYKSEAAFHHRFTAFHGVPPGALRRSSRTNS